MGEDVSMCGGGCMCGGGYERMCGGEDVSMCGGGVCVGEDMSVCVGVRMWEEVCEGTRLTAGCDCNESVCVSV